mmetsp:Transcript_8812/g.15465  ORF Transcript_8812/g.15465 Transcript_8812/m.15465 type:complete len:89 (-) Transcript_8812:753-1019(-)
MVCDEDSVFSLCAVSSVRGGHCPSVFPEDVLLRSLTERRLNGDYHAWREKEVLIIVKVQHVREAVECGADSMSTERVASIDAVLLAPL